MLKKKAMHMFFHCSNVVYSFIATKDSVRKQRWGVGGESLCQGSVFQFSFDKAIHEQVTAEKTKNKYYMRKNILNINFFYLSIFPRCTSSPPHNCSEINFLKGHFYTGVNSKMFTITLCCSSAAYKPYLSKL